MTTIKAQYQKVFYADKWQMGVTTPIFPTHSTGNLEQVKPEYESLITAFRKYIEAVNEKAGRVIDGKLEINIAEKP